MVFASGGRGQSYLIQQTGEESALSVTRYKPGLKCTITNVDYAILLTFKQRH